LLRSPVPLELRSEGWALDCLAAQCIMDEEDAVLLYRVSRLAESSPELIEATDMRRRWAVRDSNPALQPAVG
jgi:hypothetical protein